MRAVVSGWVVSLALASLPASADVFSMGGARDPATGQWTGLASLETVSVGNPGNAADTRYLTPGYGAVAYTYKIGTYEVTAGQYTAFLNAVAATDRYGLYNPDMSDTYGCQILQSGTSGSYTYSVAADYANRPVNYVSWGDAARFANWLHNGQPTGAQDFSTTEDGAYYMNGATTEAALTAIPRKSNWKWAIASEDEWYKAAYYKGGGVNAGYWDYPTRSDTPPGQDMDDASGNNANYYTAPYAYPIDGIHCTTEAGEFQNSAGPYGTFDQGGNVWEWNERMWEVVSRGLRGDSFLPNYGDWMPMRARIGASCHAAEELDDIGFRVVQIPEPASLGLLAVLALGLPRRSGRGPTRTAGRGHSRD